MHPAGMQHTFNVEHIHTGVMFWFRKVFETHLLIDYIVFGIFLDLSRAQYDFWKLVEIIS